jgi:hypothetical protein
MDNQIKQFLESKNFNDDQIYMIEKFHEIATPYATINDMIVQSMNLKKNPAMGDACKILDAAIFWQLAMKTIKSGDKEMTAKVMDRLNKVLEEM